LAGCKEKLYLPPNFGNLYGVSNALTMGTQRLLLTNQSMAREFPESMISKSFPAINTVNPDNPAYQDSLARGFTDWRLPVKGLVMQPQAFSLNELRSLPSHSQITQHSCERGWSAIAKWTGVRLAHVLNLVQLLPSARFILFRTVDEWWDSLDLFDAFHPQTMIAYGMNDADLPVAHGAPVRLRVERYLGWKNLKYLSSIEVVDRLDNIQDGSGSVGTAYGYPWYAGI
jgi:DMSO/TMAO reductase YedYZ molybdopterin-dependent catalytic subunit